MVKLPGFLVLKTETPVNGGELQDSLVKWMKHQTKSEKIDNTRKDVRTPGYIGEKVKNTSE